MEVTTSNSCVKQWLEKNKNKFFEQDVIYLEEKLNQMAQENFLKFKKIKFKSPKKVLLISIFLGPLAVDRFMLGEVWKGILKLGMNAGGVGILLILDMFSAKKRTKNKNFSLARKFLTKNNI